ncbi:MAG TPA: response regulator transcription factor [Kofleriaceae bacterium]|nr:response regulator transcription factor [Kofleriaceae bacterium]
MPPRKPAIALVSDHVMFRQLLAQRLTDQGLGPVMQLPSADKLVAAAKRRRIDVAIIDVEEGAADALAAVRTLRDEMPELHVIALATPLRETADHSTVLDTGGVERATVASALVSSLRAGNDEKPLHRHWSRITTRQREVMRWLAIGLDNAAIGQKLRIGERAVKAHVSSLLGLFGLSNRTQLALLADRSGLRPPTKR